VISVDGKTEARTGGRQKPGRREGKKKDIEPLRAKNRRRITNQDQKPEGVTPEKHFGSTKREENRSRFGSSQGRDVAAKRNGKNPHRLPEWLVKKKKQERSKSLIKEKKKRPRNKARYDKKQQFVLTATERYFPSKRKHSSSHAVKRVGDLKENHAGGP